MNTRLLSLVCFIIISQRLAFAQASQVLSFMSAVVPVPSNFIAENSKIASSDIDGDGDQDILVISYNAESFIYKNNGNGTYNKASFLPPDEYNSVESHDFDNDGDQDIVTGSGTNIIIWQNQAGNFVKTFQTIGIYVRVSDINRDGKKDLVAFREGNPNTGNYLTEILFQESMSSFPNANINLGSSAYDRRISLIDLDNDGYDDIVSNQNAPPQTYSTFYKNTSGKNYVQIPSTINFYGSSYYFDCDNDGLLDVVYGTDLGLFYSKNLGGLQFGVPIKISIAGDVLDTFGNYFYATCDFDLNGYPDLVFSDNKTVIRILLNDGTTLSSLYSVPLDGSTLVGLSVMLTDVNTDGVIDFTTLKYRGDFTTYTNQSSITGGAINLAPSAPPGLHLNTTGNELSIQWDASTDDHTPATQLSYNARIVGSTGNVMLSGEITSGTKPGKITTGNLGYHRLETFPLNGLSADTYQFQVQAIDAASAASAFSSISFVLNSGPTQLHIVPVEPKKINLSWINPGMPFDEIIIMRRTGSTEYSLLATLPANTTSFSDSPLADWTTYQYKVFTKSSTGYSVAAEATWSTDLFAVIPTNELPGAPELPYVDGGDYNNDGTIDVMVSNDLYKNVDGHFTKELTPLPSQLFFSSARFLDLNGDGTLDVVHEGLNNAGTALAENLYTNSGTAFTPATNLITTTGRPIIAMWDYDNDNDIDFLVGDRFNFRMLIRNDGNGVLNAGPDVASFCPYECAVTRIYPIDFDRDGDDDLLTFQPGENKYVVSLNQEGKMVKTGIGITTYGGIKVDPVDYNGDGWVDLFVLGSIDGPSRLFRNSGIGPTGTFSFTEVPFDQSPGSTFIDSKWADFNLDGNLDLFIADEQFKLYLGDGNGNFAMRSLFSIVRERYSRSVILDIDNDGDLDIYFAGQPRDVISGAIINSGLIIRNQTIPDKQLSSLNQPPSVPVGLNANQDQSGLHLTWNPSTDDHSKSSSLTYDIKITGNGQVLTKAAADLNTGQRKKNLPGRSLGSALLWGLTPGNYTWQVQSVDQSNLASGWSATGTFLFKPLAPVMKDTTIIRCGSTPALTAQGQNIEWYADEKLTQKIATGIFSPLVSQVVYVTQTVSNLQGIARRVSIVVQDVPDPPVLTTANPALYCPSSNSRIVTSAVGSNVHWYLNFGDTSPEVIGQTVSILASDATYYYSQTINCESVRTPIVIKGLTSNPKIINRHDSLVSLDQKGSEYRWTLNGQPLPVNSYRIGNITKGLYGLTIIKKTSNNADCPFVSDPFTFTETALSFNRELYPNPVTTEVFVPNPGGSLITISVFNSLGQQVHSLTTRDQAEYIRVATDAWRPGIFLILVSSDIVSKEYKVVKLAE